MLRRIFAYSWSKFATAERRTAWYLLRRGFLYLREPGFVVGRKPDFLTFGRGRMWVEVKSLDPPLSQEVIGNAISQLRQRFDGLRGSFRVDAWVSSSFDQRAAKMIQRLVQNEIRAGRAGGAAWYAAVPGEGALAGRAEIRWTDSRGRTVRMVTLKSAAEVYPYPLEAEPGGLTVDIQVDDGVVNSLPAYQVLSVQNIAPVMIRIEERVGGRGIASVGGARAQADTTVDRLRRVIDDANDQLKNAQKFKKVPGLVEVFLDHLVGAGQSDVMRACFGDLSVPIDASSRMAGEAFYGENGILRANKNTAVSAVTCRSRHYGTVSVLNPWAAYPLPLQWVDGIVHRVEDGRLLRAR